jgi:CubicO group peptidase (beta-lactamase class C family)
MTGIFKIFFVLFLSMFLSVSCSVDTDETIVYVYQVPERTGDGWETASLNDVGIDQEPFINLMNLLLNRENHLVHSILIVRYGKLVFEEYFDGLTHPTIGASPIRFDKDTWHVLSSVTKSYTSALLGIAIEKGYVHDIHQKVFDFFPELASLNTGQKANITIKHMLTMSSGLRWDDTTYPILDPRNDIGQFQAADNPWEMYLSRPLESVPGEEFLYSDASINVVGEIIRRSSGIRLDHFAEQFLFTPLGIGRHWWYVVKPDMGFVWASGDLRQLPRDMAKFGQLYLNRGNWRGEQIIPPEWVDVSTREYFSFSPPFWSLNMGMDGYSCGWWVRSDVYGFGAYSATGWGEQYIIVMPAFDLVAVFTGGSYYEQPLLNAHQIMVQYILPALQ